MKLINVALCACAMSACAVDEEVAVETTSQEVRRAPDFDAQMDVDGGCGALHIFSTMAQPQTGSIDYTITDLTTGGGFLYTAVLPSPGVTYDDNVLFNVLDTSTDRHRFSLEAQLMDESGAVLYQDRFRVRFPCSFPPPS
jgi:hypothetical protein